MHYNYASATIPDPIYQPFMTLLRKIQVEHIAAGKPEKTRPNKSQLMTDAIREYLLARGIEIPNDPGAMEVRQLRKVAPRKPRAAEPIPAQPASGN